MEKIQNKKNNFKKKNSYLIASIKLRFKKEKKVVATFTQNYKSGKLNQTSNKKLLFSGENDQWLILEEISR